ncbi:hypothetical protein ACJJIF_04215 [Microbulbifer sp. SSSA002]|uniref:hypothetical protein n=1 Tax=Microbulbifer sp. SSSA002 TaxID=3243376 RepID=UPI00403A576E
MKLAVRNTFALGIALLAGSIAWVWVGLSKSYALIAAANNPLLSAERGFIDAMDDFSRNRATFIEIYTPGLGDVAPGISAEDLQGRLAEYRQGDYFICGTGLHIQGYVLDIKKHEHNKFYAQAYNAKLLELITVSTPEQ